MSEDDVAAAFAQIRRAEEMIEAAMIANGINDGHAIVHPDFTCTLFSDHAVFLVGDARPRRKDRVTVPYGEPIDNMIAEAGSFARRGKTQ